MNHKQLIDILNLVKEGEPGNAIKEYICKYIPLKTDLTETLGLFDYLHTSGRITLEQRYIIFKAITELDKEGKYYINPLHSLKFIDNIDIDSE